MGKQILYIMMFISAFWIVCEIPEPPPSAENVSLGLGFERSNGEIIKGTSLEDTTDNCYLPHFHHTLPKKFLTL